MVDSVHGDVGRMVLVPHQLPRHRNLRAMGDSRSDGLDSTYHPASGAAWLAEVDGVVPSICCRLTPDRPCAVSLSRHSALRTRPFSSIPVGGSLVFSKALVRPDRRRNVDRFAILSALSLRSVAMGRVIQ